MPATYEVLPHQGRATPAEAFARDVLAGLSATPKSIPACYFYDETGSRLFEQITALPEYYLTRCEREILETCREDLAREAGRGPFRLVELGAGDGHKTEVLLRHFLKGGLRFQYVPVDICRETVAALAAKLRETPDLAGLCAHGIVAEYFDALALLEKRNAHRNMVLFLGSNIGNFDPFDARQFLRGLRESLHPGDLALIGFDLKKDPGLLNLAYNDAEGITRAFNLNLLDRINRELGGRFDRRRFVHYGCYNVLHARMESWLVSTQAQEVEIRRLHRTFPFAAWEGIHVECSYKYDVAEIEAMAQSAGFCVRQHFFDRRKYFADSLWEAS